MRPSRMVLRLCLAMGLSTWGCTINRQKFEFCKPADLSCVQPALGATQLEVSDATLCAERDSMYCEPDSPLSLDEQALSPDRLIPMTLEDCIQQALSTSKIMRDLGGTVVRSPQTVNSNVDPGLVFSDPRSGEEAALSAFDANLFVSNYFERNHRGLNNQFFGQNGEFEQNLNTTQSGINKRSATGGLYTIRKFEVYDRNNQLSNRFSSHSWDSYIEGEMRQPLLQGAGTEFNRIAGPGAVPGQLNGVLLARVRTDISLTDFERSVRDLVADVENAYWDLYYSYRDLEARIEVRDIAELTFKQLDTNAVSQGKKAQAVEQVLRFQSEVVDSLNGRPIDGTRLNNGSAAGTFRSSGGVRISERKLRLMIGLPINDGRLIRTVQSPTMTPVTYDWNASISDAMQHREELRRQRWVIKQRELELVANRNFLKPQLDVIGRYRLRGFGEDLFGPDSAYSSMYDGQFQEWQAGVEYNMPIGFRRAAAAVQNSRLALARDVEVLKEQERFVHFGLSNAIAEAKRAQENLALQRQRLDAIVLQLEFIDSRKAAEKAELDVELETHRRLLDARLRFHQAEVEYALALRNVNFEKGTLLSYCNINLAESITHPKAQNDAAERIKFQNFDKVPANRDAIIGKKAVGNSQMQTAQPIEGMIQDVSSQGVSIQASDMPQVQAPGQAPEPVAVPEAKLPAADALDKVPDVPTVPDNQPPAQPVVPPPAAPNGPANSDTIKFSFSDINAQGTTNSSMPRPIMAMPVQPQASHTVPAAAVGRPSRPVVSIPVTLSPMPVAPASFQAPSRVQATSPSMAPTMAPTYSGPKPLRIESPTGQALKPTATKLEPAVGLNKSTGKPVGNRPMPMTQKNLWR